MLTEKILREISEMEEAGLKVTIKSDDGTELYSTQSVIESKHCNGCGFFRLLPDPDPYDWFRDGDQKAVCTKVNGVIEGGLERPSEWNNVCKPLYCPKLGRMLDKEEKEEAAKRLKYARMRMK